MKMYDIPREMVTDLWSAVEPMLSKAMTHHPHLDAPGLLKLLVSNFAQLIIATEDGRIVAAAVMERTAYPDHVVGNVVALAGETGVYRKYIDDIVTHLEAWSRKHGCDTIAFVGRPGWTRFALRRGGKQIALVHAWKALERPQG